jgi:hypothetical protein
VKARTLRRLPVLLAAGLLTACSRSVPVGTPSARAVTSPAPSDALTKELEEARKAGLPTSAKELQPPLPPDDQNAALLYLKWADMRKSKAITGDDEAEVTKLSDITVPDLQVVAGRRILAEKQDALRMIHQAVSRPYCVFVKDWSQGLAILYPELAYVRSMARWLIAESGVMLRDGKPMEAIHNTALGFQMVRHVAQNPDEIHYLVAIALQRTTLGALENILLAYGDKPEVVSAVQQVVDKEMPRLKASDGLRAQIVMVLATADLLRKSEEEQRRDFGLTNNKDATMLDALRTLMQPNVEAENLKDKNPPLVMPMTTSMPSRKDPAAYGRWVDENAILAVRSLRTIIPAADKPFEEANKTVRTVARDLLYQTFKDAAPELLKGKDPKVEKPLPPSSATLASLFIMGCGEIITARVRDYTNARTDALRAGAALMNFRAKRGRFPDKLADAVSPVPTDPFDGKPLKYRREGAGFVVYAAGRNLDFNGGTPGKKPNLREAFFRYPASAYRR